MSSNTEVSQGIAEVSEVSEVSDVFVGDSSVVGAASSLSLSCSAREKPTRERTLADGGSKLRGWSDGIRLRDWRLSQLR